MPDWVDLKFESYAITDSIDQWSPSYISDRDKFLTSLTGTSVSLANRWKFYILRVERRLRYVNAEHQPFKKLSGEDLVTLLALHTTIISLSISDVSKLYTKTALIGSVSALTNTSVGTARTWVEALTQKGVIKELSDPTLTNDKRKKYLYAPSNTRVEFYKDCIYEMVVHIGRVADLFGQHSIQLQREIDLFAGYEIIKKEEIFQFLEEIKK